MFKIDNVEIKLHCDVYNYTNVKLIVLFSLLKFINDKPLVIDTLTNVISHHKINMF